ncbi:germination protein YpeB [Paracerasibacillus soli]|uniref:Germination protein YpeB n=1 Tax=Paracerasibacillus soli TaxID=480284 RepID=A0ABU5CR96_9BACI|nr:germination protein YpeB [Virgibacillus soli]MDY0408329.1 germination protein YpeB [Virgibacillus soli]
MIRNILIAILAVGIVGMGVWGYKEHNEKNAILIQAENTYQRSFHELSYHMDLLHDKIGTALAMNSPTSLSPQLIEIWRITSEALSNVGQLPLTLLPFNKTEGFLSNIGDFTYRTAVRDLDTEPLSKKEMRTLRDLYGQAHDIKNELRQVQHLVLDNNLRWMDVQLALATQDEQADNTIIDGLKTVEKKVEGYAEGNDDSPLIGPNTEDHTFENVKGKKISEQEALEQGQRIFHIKDTSKVKVTKTGDGATNPLYSLSYEENDKRAYMDISEKGGHPITLLVNRTMDEKKLSLNDGYEAARKYIKKLGLDQMVLLQSAEYDDTGVYSFIYEDNGVRVYPDSVDVKVALDNGDIIGLTTRNFYMNHKKRDIPQPEISKEEAERSLNPNLKIHEDFVAIVENDLGKEVLVYEFLGTLDDDTYRIFINANDGKEEIVEKLGHAEMNFSAYKSVKRKGK